jgi:hypothetical protein
MRIKLDLEISQWTKWLAGGIAIGFTLGLGAWRVYADVPNTFKAGDTVSAQKMMDNFNALQASVNSLAPKFTPVTYYFGIQSNPPSGVTVTHPSGASTVTFVVAGLYKVTLTARASHTDNFTNVSTKWVIGGDATRLDSMSRCAESAPTAPQYADLIATCTTVWRATAGQTATLLPQYDVTYTMPGHDFAFGYIVERIGD